MRSLILVLSLALTTALVASEASARRRTAKSARGPYSIAVAPFDGDKAGGRTISEAIELELELIETVLVKGDRWLRSDLRRAGSAGWEPSALRRIMKKRKVDILVRGRRAGEEIEVQVFGDDGRPRFSERFSLPRDPDKSAREIVERMRPTLVRWPRAKVVEPSSGQTGVLVRTPEREPEPSPRVDEEDLFVDFGAEKEEVRDTSLQPPSDRMPGGDGDEEPADDDPDDEAVSQRRSPPREDTRGGGRRRLLLDDGDDEDDEGRAQRRFVTRDEPERQPELSMADVEEDDGKKAPLLHWIAVSAGASFGAWYYEFAAAKDVEDDFSRMFTSYGGGARASVWPLEYVGLDAMLNVTTFHVVAAGLPVRPTELDVLGVMAAASARARYPFKLGSFAIAPGVRAGYRFWGSFVEPQTNTDDDRAYTLIPGWQMHALTVGGEVQASFVYDRWRFEGELHAEPLPLVRYEELPDNPAVLSRPFGGTTTLLIRIPIYAPVYVELHGTTTVLLVTWEGGPGTRLSQTRVDGSNNRLRVDGGQSLNAGFGGGLAVGASF